MTVSSCKKTPTEAKFDVPAVTTGAVFSITVNSAEVAGNVTDSSGATVTARGVCYSTTQNPTTAGTCVASGSGTGTFSALMSGLTSGTQYYVRAYATNSAGTAYGSQTSFTTNAARATVTTGTVSAISGTGATVAGNVTDSGGAPVTTRGVCYSTIPNSTSWSSSPTSTSGCLGTSGGIGAFTVSITGLLAETAYYAVAFAINSGGASIGSQVSFTTSSLASSAPSVTTGAVTSITSTGATVAGNVTDSGGSAVTARGVCYATTQNPTTAGTCVASGSGTGTFSAVISSLTVGTTYYVRAFATSSGGTAYGSQSSFTTLSSASSASSAPSVTTGSVTSITSLGATVAGNVTATGGATVTGRGVCYATTQNPTISSTCVASGTGTGSFSATITGLSAGVTYFVRAYAINSAGVAYGSNVQFTTTPAPTGSVTDIDGNVYPTMQIGTQVWMAANLRTTRYSDGATIPNVTTAQTWSGLLLGA